VVTSFRGLQNAIAIGGMPKIFCYSKNATAQTVFSNEVMMPYLVSMPCQLNIPLTSDNDWLTIKPSYSFQQEQLHAEECLSSVQVLLFAALYVR
jgi:hypothetical protein